MPAAIVLVGLPTIPPGGAAPAPETASKTPTRVVRTRESRSPLLISIPPGLDGVDAAVAGLEPDDPLTTLQPSGRALGGTRSRRACSRSAPSLTCEPGT